MKIWKFILCSAGVGLTVGFVNGFMGAGGGMLFVPLFVLFWKTSPRVTHSTAVFVILPVCIISGIAYMVKGLVDYKILLPVAIGTLIGGIVGTFLLKKLSAVWINYIFYAVMIGAGVWILVK